MFSLINFTVPNILKSDMENTKIQYQARYKISYLILEHACNQNSVMDISRGYKKNNGRYDMTLCRDLLTALVLDLKFS